MSAYKLTYFNVRGRAEFVRYLFHYKGVPFEDFRINRDDWPKNKSDMPMGQVPTLEVDGDLLWQSLSMGRFLARSFGLSGKDDLESAKIDQIVYGVYDLYPAFRPYVFAKREGDEDKMKSIWKQFRSENLVPLMERYEKFLGKNDSGCFVGKELSWADFYVGEFLERMEVICDGTVLEGHPNLKALVRKIHSLPSLQAYLKSRPSTPL